MISIITDINNFDLKNWLWSGALDTYNEIMGNDKLHELMYLLEELYPEPIDITTINDLLWFDSDWIYEQLGIDLDVDAELNASISL